MDLAEAAQPGAGELGAAVPAVAAAGTEVLVAVGVAVRFVGEAAGEHRAGADAAGIDAAGVLRADAEVVPGVLAAAGQPGLAAQQAVAAGGHAEGRPQAAIARTAAGEDLDHSPDRVGAVQAGTRAAHDLDALDLLHRNLLERRQPGADRSHPHAIDQQQGMSGVGAAQEQRGLLAVAAAVGEAHPGQPGQQVRHRQRLQPLDVGTGDHADRRQRLVGGDRGTRGGHDHRRQRRRIVLDGGLRGHRATEQRHCQQGFLHHVRSSTPRTRARLMGSMS